MLRCLTEVNSSIRQTFSHLETFSLTLQKNAIKILLTLSNSRNYPLMLREAQMIRQVTGI